MVASSWLSGQRRDAMHWPDTEFWSLAQAGAEQKKNNFAESRHDKGSKV